MYKYSEIFYSIQGEGEYTGVPTAWLRFFLCNLQCNGFGQVDPTDESTYELPYVDFDPTTVKRIEDLPVWTKGCDSSYSWHKKFKGLQREGSGYDIAAALTDCMITDSNPLGLFKHPHSGQEQHLCFTGGEPLGKRAQKATVDILPELAKMYNFPKFITYETNGTQPLSEDLSNVIDEYLTAGMLKELFFSVSPKLWTVAGEESKKAIKPEIVSSYRHIKKFCGRPSKNGYGVNGQLKFVLGTDEKQWVEMETHLKAYRDEGVDWPVWIMPVGATVEGQEEVAGTVAKMAFERGYNVAARVHTYLFGNAIGT
jgi:7-carboxy-7-deazaguanine synthase